MADFRLDGNGVVTIKVQALNAHIVSGGYIKLVAPEHAASIPANHPELGTAQWTVPAEPGSVYALIVQLPRIAGQPLSDHPLRRTVSQQIDGNSHDLPSSAANPKNTHPMISLPVNQVLYTEIIKFK